MFKLTIYKKKSHLTLILAGVFSAYSYANINDVIILAQASSNITQSTKSSARNTESIVSINNTPIAISIYPGQVRVIEQADVERIAIGNGKLVTASVVANKQIVLLGEATGVTSLYVWLKNGTQRNYEVTVSTEDASKSNALKVTEELRSLLALDPEVKVTTVGDRVVLNGKYSNQETAEKVKKIAAAYPQVLNLINQQPVEVKVIPEKMVLLEVKVIEARKSALDNLGIQWSTKGVSGPTFNNNSLFYTNTGVRPGFAKQPEGSSFPFATLARPFLSYLGIASQITSMLNFLETNGDLWIMAEPRISTVSGGKSKVQVGGQIPIPVATGPGQISVIYKDYGVILEFEPVVDSEGNIRSRIKSEVSSLDATNSGQYAAFFTNITESEVSIKANETLVISGLLQNTGTKSTEGVSGLANIPLFGKLFSNKEFRNDRTEVLLVVTPRLHSPNSEKAIEQLEKFSKETGKVMTIIDER
jgi:pilus assembly protein CpaC